MQIEDWTRADLEKLIADDARESLTLDYKRSAALGRENKQRNELSKDVSAFANSAGGTIVYGIIEKGHKPDAVDEGCDDALITRETIEQIINSTIQPRIQGVIIKQIALKPGRSAYVISIPQAMSLAPHQANDNKYYRRFNFESVPMADYEVRDALRRATVPDLYIDLQFSDFTPTLDGRLRTIMAVNIGNHSVEPAFYTTIEVGIDGRASSEAELLAEEWTRRDEAPFHFDHGHFDVTHYGRRMMVPNATPIFRERDFMIGKFEVVVDRNGGGHFIGYDVSCPGFRVRKGHILNAIGGKAVFSEVTSRTPLGKL